MEKMKTIIMGAAGRDFHNFNVFFRNNPKYEVVAFTATQIPFISGRRYPNGLAGRLYPRGIPIFDEKELVGLIKKNKVDVVVFSYSDISHEEVMHKASIVLAAGADFWLLGPNATQLKSKKPVVSIVATRTGAGKTTIARFVAKILREEGYRTGIIRHPMPYGNLSRQVCQRFGSYDDLKGSTIEEREEYEGYIGEGFVVWAGVDYEKILGAAEEECDAIVFEGGNNDFSLIKPDVLITVVDPTRPGQETKSFPGEVNARNADVIVINKVNIVQKSTVASMEKSVRSLNSVAPIIRVSSVINVDKPELVKGKRAVVIEDGPTVTHGGLRSAAGTAAARELKVKIVKPKGVGSIAAAIKRYGLRVIPALGYSLSQVRELEKTINSTKCDAVISATPCNLEDMMKIKWPIVRVRYDAVEQKPMLRAILRRALQKV